MEQFVMARRLPVRLLQRCFQSTRAAAAVATQSTTTSAPSRRSVRHQRQEFSKLEAALRAFQAQHGHLAVPLRFTIPSQSRHDSADLSSSTTSDACPDWPEELQGMKLGTALSRFLKVAQKPENAAITAKLTALGVPVEAVHSGDWKQFLWEHVAVVALQTYRALHGHFFVPYAFQVPHGDAQWPRQTWGYKLGYWVVELRRDKSRLAPYQLRDLRAMRFVWNAREARWNQFFVPAMTKFAELYGPNARVPQSFVVPSDDARWPRALHGYRLGQKVNNLRCSGSYASVENVENVDNGEWDDDVELVYNNWVLLDLLHDDDDGDDGEKQRSKDDGSGSGDSADSDSSSATSNSEDSQVAVELAQQL